MKKTIYWDADLTFGKYKGRSVEEVMRADTGYFLWCVTAGTHKLDEEVERVVRLWVEANPKKALDTVQSAEKFKREKGIKDDDPSVPFAESVTDEVKFIVTSNPLPSERPAAWGSW